MFLYFIAILFLLGEGAGGGGSQHTHHRLAAQSFVVTHGFSIFYSYSFPVGNAAEENESEVVGGVREQVHRTHQALTHKDIII